MVSSLSKKMTDPHPRATSVNASSVGSCPLTRLLASRARLIASIPQSTTVVMSKKAYRTDVLQRPKRGVEQSHPYG